MIQVVGMVSVAAYQVAVAFDLRVAPFDKPSFDISARQFGFFT